MLSENNILKKQLYGVILIFHNQNESRMQFLLILK